MCVSLVCSHLEPQQHSLFFLVSRCQRGRDFRDLRFVSFLSCVHVFLAFALVGLSVRPKFESYGVRHMLPYLSSIIIYVTIQRMSCLLILLSHLCCSHLPCLDCWSLKCRGSVDPSMCVVQSKALIQIAHIQGEPIYILGRWGFALVLYLSCLCKSRIVINPPKRGRL